MAIVFIAILIITSELVYSVASNQQNGIYEFPCGVIVMCSALRILILTMSVWYCGWILGIVLFACVYFSLIHGTVGWIFSLPLLFAKTDSQIMTVVYIEYALLILTNILMLVFCIFSFILVPYETFLHFISLRQSTIIISLVVAVLCFILRAIISKYYH